MYAKLLCTLITLLVLSSYAACTPGGPDVTAHGSASAVWSIAVADQSATCASVGATSVALLLHPRRGEDVTASFPCVIGQGTTPPVTAGPYDATLTLRAADGAVIATSQPQPGVTIGADQTTALAPVRFVVEERGTLVVSLSPVAARDNCTEPSKGGAGITGNVITLQHAFGSCAAVTFKRARGTTTLGTYTVDCGSPTATSCIERDETLTADVPPGAYVIHVAGLRGAVRCREEFDAFNLAAGGVTTAKTVQLAPSRAPGC